LRRALAAFQNCNHRTIGGYFRMWSKWFIRFNNRVTRWRRVRVAPGELLLLLPHCLQGVGCGQDVVADAANCRACGKCPYHELLPLAARYGVQVRVAAGGRQAVAAVRAANVKAVVSVACARELASGIMMTFPKPVLAIENRQPRGPCQGTEVDATLVEQAMVELLRTSQPREG